MLKSACKRMVAVDGMPTVPAGHLRTGRHGPWAAQSPPEPLIEHLACHWNERSTGPGQLPPLGPLTTSAEERMRRHSSIPGRAPQKRTCFASLSIALATAVTNLTAAPAIDQDKSIATATVADSGGRTAATGNSNGGLPCEAEELTGSGLESDFGRSVSVSGDIAVVGDPRFPGPGAAFVFLRSGFNWEPIAELTAPLPQLGDAFGHSVAVQGDAVLIGSPGSSANGFQSGVACLFRLDREALQWRHETTLTASDGDPGDIFGWSVSLSHDVAIIGARDDENNGVTQSGSAYVFRNLDGRWVEEAKLVDDQGQVHDLFGNSVSVDGEVVLVGANGNGDAAGPGSGAAFVFRRFAGEWHLERQLTAPDAAGDARFGFSASLASGAAVIGAYLDDEQGGDAGAAYVFRSNGTAWNLETKLLASDGAALDWFGRSVTIADDATTILVGALLDDDVGSESGSSYIYRHDANTWREVGKITASPGGPLENFGASVAVDNDVGLVGSTPEGPDPGRAYVFLGFTPSDCNLNSLPDTCDILGGGWRDDNENRVPDACEESADVNADGTVDILDLLLLLESWGSCGPTCRQFCPGDLDADCLVDRADLWLLLWSWSITTS